MHEHLGLLSAFPSLPPHLACQRNWAMKARASPLSSFPLPIHHASASWQRLRVPPTPHLFSMPEHLGQGSTCPFPPTSRPTPLIHATDASAP
jgi:hypothetical protein